MARILINAASIRLHSPFVATSSTSWSKTVLAARSFVQIFDAVDVENIGVMNPVIGTLWPIACQALISSMNQLNALQGATNPLGISAEDVEVVLDQAFAFM